MSRFPLQFVDYLAFTAFFVVLSAIGYWAGRRERASAQEYFLAGKRLPWYVIGGSFIASNISTEHFIGMIGAAVVYGICVALSEWMNVITFSLLIWIFIPFLLASRVFTIPEFLERRFGPALRLIFAVVTIISNVVAFLAAVLYGGALALHNLFGWDLWLALIGLGVVAGMWAIYGGLSSVAWTDLFTVVVMVLGGVSVTVYGLYELAGEGGSLTDGFAVMLSRNEATTGVWREAVAQNTDNLAAAASYNRLSVFQPASHPTHPWVSLLFSIVSVSIWYNVLNQFMIQRVLGARDAYHARMGIVLAGFLKLILPIIVVIPGLILFALRPEILLQPWDKVRVAADQGYVAMVQQLVPIGLRGLLLAALFGAIQLNGQFGAQLDRHGLYDGRVSALAASRFQRQAVGRCRRRVVLCCIAGRHHSGRIHRPAGWQLVRVYPIALCFLRTSLRGCVPARHPVKTHQRHGSDGCRGDRFRVWNRHQVAPGPSARPLCVA